MGADIHIFAEKRNPATNKWEKIGKKFIDNYSLSVMGKDISEKVGVDRDKVQNIVMMYINGDKPTNPLEKYIIGDLIPNRIASEDEDLEWWNAVDKGRYSYPYSDQPYDGRNYTLFNVLAGVRGDGEGQIDDVRGIPDDSSDVIKTMNDDWGMDGHSATYYTLDELLNSDYGKMSKDELHELGIDAFFFHGMLDGALKLVDDPSDLRFVFWFDN